MKRIKIGVFGAGRGEGIAQNFMLLNCDIVAICDCHKERREEDRARWENDRLTPFEGSDGSAPSLPCCSHPDFKPTEHQVALYHQTLDR